MKATQTLIATTKELPKEAVLISHQYMLKAGLIKKLASGIYTWMPLGLKVLQKIQNIVRDEMNKAGASELLLPSILPSELLQETHRWDKFGPELLKLHDRHNRDFCYGPTHEEPIVDMARDTIKSYKQLPLNLYQIQTKFRDEIRPRFGVMRAREFIMKDAYSFHENSQCLRNTYNTMYATYCNILDKIGLAYRPVKADTGAIGGDNSHEFQVLANAGEDIICYSNGSDYAANIELATYAKPDLSKRVNSQNTIEKIHTPNIKTIEKLCKEMSFDIKKTIKTMVIKDAGGNFFALVIRGDHELNETKINKLDQIIAPYTLATKEEIFSIFNANPGSLGIYNCPISIIADYSAIAITDLVCGANEDDYHFTNVNWDRDVTNYQIADIRNVVTGDISPDGKGTLELTNGIEVGHIFELEDVYSKPMNANIIGQDGKSKPMLMGCYGFGVSRVMAAAIEQSHDENGIIWPESIAPYQVAILPINYNKSAKVKEVADKLCQDLLGDGIDVLLDDRGARPGVMFADADLIGYSHHVVIGDRLLEQGLIEYKNRKTQEKQEITIAELIKILK
ncbi:proline--tRNA ligase [Francisella tularensis subsp. holarctica FSC022]|uniref:proline--tRNA ligase n=1 Tax=Francisella tularensis TaxID=263 RepID=UPI00015D79A9|nr:proline--tRNA ligase [Francisella tularensis]EDO65957.1 prolyl-tRNA synthetase [Francisella tularensis subsp. holarctica FSC022]KIP30101.1 proline--tRNA ligase [Francisella tularensis subsp. holarctica]MCC9171472.1 proline--tRNA ligase [Francisella tularensis]OCQ69827.1 proline--tRNA ligase [Francisella tularensis]OPH23974.1 proline--tRNA ligase [Francisella tularensis subsp. holarctica FSC022]